MRRRRSSTVFDAANLDPRLRAGLVGHWVGLGSNRTWNDWSGNGRHGIAPGSPSDSRRVLDRSADFRGTPCLNHPGNVFASYDVTHHADLDMSSSGFSAAAWVYLRGTSSIHMVVSKYPGYYLYVDGSQERASFTYGGADHLTASGTFPRLKWVHFAATYDGTNYAMYFNGVEVKTGTHAASGTGATFSIGNYGLTYPWNGLISDLRIYKRSISVAEIAILSSPDFSPVTRSRRRSTTNPATASQGTLAVTLDAATLSATATIPSQGVLSQTLGTATLAGTGQTPSQGTLAVTLDEATLVATGTVANQVFTGTLAVTLDAATLVAAGSVVATFPASSSTASSAWTTNTAGALSTTTAATSPASSAWTVNALSFPVDAPCIHITELDSPTVGLVIASPSSGLTVSSPTAVLSVTCPSCGLSVASPTVTLTIREC